MEEKYALSEEKMKELAFANKLTLKQVYTVLDLLKEGCTVPFIARYRKEATGALDEEQIKVLSDEYEYKKSLEKRKEDIIRLIAEKGLMTDELEKQILNANKLVEVEDLYRPFKEKKKTKATEAIKLGLEPLAKLMLEFPMDKSVEEYCAPFINEKVPTVEFAITNACYIIAEVISDNAKYRTYLRNQIETKGILISKVKKDAVDEKKIFSSYYEYQEEVKNIKPHRILAINRGENQNILNVNIDFNKEIAHAYLESQVITKKGIFNEDIKNAIADSHKRLIFPSLEREIRADLKDKAEMQSLKIFSLNLKNLLLQPPVKGKMVLGVDPSYRTGCKLAVIDPTGKVLEIGVIYPNELSKGAGVNPATLEKSKKTCKDLIAKYKINLIAIGNGTASRETEAFFAGLIKEIDNKVLYVIVSEAGASIYSASDIAREEFPTYEVQQRSAVSIARRLQDPLSELVKIEPRSIGVGQYQYDVTPHKLDESLDFVVVEAVNKVGVDVNTASKSLLMYVSGLNKQTAQNIVKFREENGTFHSRKDILNVPKLGNKSYEQAIGFLRIIDGVEPLDKTSIHPESYQKTKKIMKELNISADMIGQEAVKDIIANCNRDDLAQKIDIDKYTLDDILDSLANPLRDIRDKYDAPLLRSDVLTLADVKIGMELEGTVRNVVDFGCFIDCGLTIDGLLHISKMAKNKFIKHPSEVLSVGQLIKVYVDSIDLERERIAFTLLKN